MDEPLSNLDQELRQIVRFELIKLLRNLETTTLIVSHDTEDALAISDKIIVLKDGCVAQVGSPQEIFNSPISKYVALLFGKSNFIPKNCFLENTKNNVIIENNEEFIAIRPGQLKIINHSEKNKPGFLAEGFVVGVCFLGVSRQITVDCKVFVVEVNVINFMNYNLGEKVNVAVESTFLESI